MLLFCNRENVLSTLKGEPFDLLEENGLDLHCEFV